MLSDSIGVVQVIDSSIGTVQYICNSPDEEVKPDTTVNVIETELSEQKTLIHYFFFFTKSILFCTHV